MPLHLIKLSVGTDSIEDLEDWIKLKYAEQKKRGVKKPERFHTTRMVPKRVEEVLGFFAIDLTGWVEFGVELAGGFAVGLRRFVFFRWKEARIYAHLARLSSLEALSRR